jgi:hypothetical protein
MKKSLFIVVALVIINAITTAQISTSDFRSFTWGSSLNQVIKNEKGKFIKQDKDDFLLYEDQLAGSDCEVIYQFNDNDKLVSGTYIFTKIFPNPQLYIQTYNKFKDLLKSKYGNPKLSKEEWSANNTPTDNENYGQAVADGDLSLYSIWTSDRSIIKITLNNTNHGPSLQIHYTDKTLDEMENKEQLKNAMLKL